MRTIRSALCLLVVAPLLVAACGDDGDDAAAPSGATTAASGPAGDSPSASPSGSAGIDPSSDQAFPVTVRSGAGDTATEITIEGPPEAIVSLSPTATEMLFAVGAGDAVIAVDDRSDYPEGVPLTDLSGFEPNVEAVLGYSPDLVLASGDANDLVAGLDAAGVPTLLLPAATTLEEAYEQIEIVGAATGHVGEAAEVVAGMQSDIDAIITALPETGEPQTYYHELDPTFFTVTSETFIGDVYSRLGLVGIADQAGDPAADPYPQLSEEFVVSADPDLIFLADAECCGVTAGQVAARPGWSQITAVVEGRIHPVDEDIASRWGPRVVDFMTEVAEYVAVGQPVG
jgi:iron complex transport system substrate-binding protein